MIRFGICDDDKEYMKSIIKTIYTTFDSVKTFDESCECILYDTGEKIISNFVNDKIDIFLLDIECGEMSGFEIAKELLKRKKNLGIVYITNHANYVYESYVCRPLGFVRKNSLENDLRMYMINIIEFLEERKRTVVFECNRGDIELHLSDMISVEAFNHELKITLMNRVVECKGPLSRYEKSLEASGFIKISRAILVNKKYITRIVADQVFLCGNIKYIISRRRIREVRDSWGKAE